MDGNFTYLTYPHGYSKLEVSRLKKEAFLLGKKRLDTAYETDESEDNHKDAIALSCNDIFKGHSEAADPCHSVSAPDQPRRNSDEAGQRTGAKVEEADAKAAKRSTMQQFLDNFRPRAKSESARTMSRPGAKQRQGSGESGQPTHRRPRSPVGGIVSRLRHLGNETDKKRHSSARAVPQLPHPSDMPLDHTYCADLAEERRQRMRRAVSTSDAYADKLSESRRPGSIHERHRDLFENLSHSPDIEGQCSILSAAALAESCAHRSHQMSGPLTSPSARQPAPSGNHDVQVTENEKYIIFRTKCQHDSVSIDLDELRAQTVSDPSRVFEIFARKHRCYDLIPTSCKLLVFDNNLNVKKAFFALVYNGLRAAPLWDTTQQRFVGMLTITDFIYILQSNYKSSLTPMEELESHRIATWRAHLKARLRPLAWISPEASLLDAVRVLLHVRVHRLPVIDPRTGNALFIITHKRVLKYMYLYMHQLPMPAWLRRGVKQLGVGTHSGVLTVEDSTPLVKVLEIFVQNRVSALPVVDKDGALVDIYSKFDVINLAATKTYSNLEIPVSEALQYRRDRFEGVATCTADDSLEEVIEKLVSAEVHRLVVVDANKRVVGLVSLSDVLKAVVLDYDALTDVSVSGETPADGPFVTGEQVEIC